MNIKNQLEVTKAVIQAYDAIAEKYNATYADNDLVDYQYMLSFLSALSGKKILDMGCGCGESTSYLASKNFDVIGIDLSDNMLNEARHLYPFLHFEKQDILSTSFSESSFDGIVLTYVVNHFNESGLHLLKSEVDRLLKNQGLVFLSAHVGEGEELLPDPLDETIQIYYNFLNIKKLSYIFNDYSLLDFSIRHSFGPEEFLCDKLFATYRKN